MGNCSICSSKETISLIDIGKTPIAGEYLENPEGRDLYPLEVQVCKNCSHAELVDKLPPKILYGKSFDYLSSSSPGLKEYFAMIIEYAKDLLIGDKSNITWLDIGSNDGLLLDLVRSNGIDTYGIEPSSYQAAISETKGHKQIINDYCTLDAMDKLSCNKFSIITILNTLSNCIDPMDILKISSKYLEEDGILAISTGSLEAICKGNLDYIYHEHNHYFSIQSIGKIAALLNMRVIRFEKTFQKGGSMLIFFQKNRETNQAKDEAWSLNEESREYSANDYKQRISHSYDKLMKLKDKVNTKIQKIKKDGGYIMCFGASQSTTTLMSILLMGEEFKCYIDDNPRKLLTYSPLNNRPVLSTKMIIGELINSEKKILVVPGGWRFSEMWINKHCLLQYKNLEILEFNMIVECK